MIVLHTRHQHSVDDVNIATNTIVYYTIYMPYIHYYANAIHAIYINVPVLYILLPPPSR